MIVRRALPCDKGRLLVMARAFHAASGTPLPFSAAAASLVADAAMADPDRLCLVLADAGGTARGALLALAGDHHFSPVRIASEIMWWIDPDYRGRAAGDMIAAYEQWAAERGCDFIHMAGLGGDPAVSALYRRRGYQPAETHFMKPITG